MRVQLKWQTTQEMRLSLEARSSRSLLSDPATFVASLNISLLHDLRGASSFQTGRVATLRPSWLENATPYWVITASSRQVSEEYQLLLQ